MTILLPPERPLPESLTSLGAYAHMEIEMSASLQGYKNPLASLGIMGPALGFGGSLFSFILANWDQISTTAGLVWTLGGAAVAGATGIYGRWKATKKIASITKAIPVIFLALILLPSVAFAQDGNGINVPWGDWTARWLTGIQDIVLIALTTAATYVVGVYMPAWLKAIAGKNAQIRVNEVIEKAVLSAIGQTKGAVVGKRLSIPVANEVLRRAGQYAIDQAPELVDSAAETSRDLIKLILARMEQFGVAPIGGGITVATKAGEKKPSETDFASAISKGLGSK